MSTGPIPVPVERHGIMTVYDLITYLEDCPAVALVRVRFNDDPLDTTPGAIRVSRVDTERGTKYVVIEPA